MTSDDGTRKCLELMTMGKWVTGESNHAVARQFGVSPETVKEWATSASRIIRIALDGTDAKEDIRARLVATLDRIVSKTVEKNGKVAVAAISEQGRLLGLVTQAHKVDMTVRQYEELAPSALHARLLDQRAKLNEAISKLEGEHPELTVLPWPAGPEGAVHVERTADPTRLAGMQLVTGLPTADEVHRAIDKKLGDVGVGVLCGKHGVSIGHAACPICEQESQT